MDLTLESKMKDELRCPQCHSLEVTVSHVELFMANTDEHYCHSIKTHDPYSPASCLSCNWQGERDQLIRDNG